MYWGHVWVWKWKQGQQVFIFSWANPRIFFKMKQSKNVNISVSQRIPNQCFQISDYENSSKWKYLQEDWSNHCYQELLWDVCTLLSHFPDRHVVAWKGKVNKKGTKGNRSWEEKSRKGEKKWGERVDGIKNNKFWNHMGINLNSGFCHVSLLKLSHLYSGHDYIYFVE